MSAAATANDELNMMIERPDEVEKPDEVEEPAEVEKRD